MKYLSYCLACLLFVFRWKARVVDTNLALWQGRIPTPGRWFRLAWCLCLSRDLLDSLFGRTDYRIDLRPQDRSKFEVLQSQPSLFLTGHFHNWEMLAGWLARQGVPLLGSARPLASPLFHTWLSNLRTRNGVPVVTQGILYRALSHLRAGGCFGILWDQYSPLHRHSSPLFGIPAAMDPLPEILVRRLRPAVMAGFLLPGGKVRLVSLLAAGDERFDAARLSRRFHRVLETLILKHPAYWYGLCHARYKDTFRYPGRRKVSRETYPLNPGSAGMVSRETLVQDPIA